METPFKLKNKMELENDFEIDIEKMTLEKMTLDNKDRLLSRPAYCIYRVPPLIRKSKEEAYTPVVVSIGPFHYRDERLQDMEEHKQFVFRTFLQRARASFEEMVNFVNQSEPKVRASYSENIKLTVEEFVKLILMDAAFIIEFIVSNRNREILKDAKLSQLYLQGSVFRDLLLLENQLPFFVIEELFDMSFPPNHRGDLPSFLDITFSFFEGLNKQKLKPDPDVRINHFTDLLRLFYLPTTKPVRSKFQPEERLLCSAKELLDAGVTFKSADSICLLDLNFSECVLEVPHILVDDSTEFWFRNMIALEHCHHPNDSYIVDYALMWDCLINTNKDVDVLIRKGIIQNWLGDTSEVATLFNGLGKNILTLTCSSEYLKIFKELNDFYHDPLHKMKATLRRDYCNTPWKTLGTVVGIIVLILGTTQTLLSLLRAVFKIG